MKNSGLREREFIAMRGKSIILLEDSHASSSRPSDSCSIKMKMLEWLQVVA
jgi:hypothetical protein